MRNIELKARLKDLAAAEATAIRLCGPEWHIRVRQVDTYFNVPAGRLKLREATGSAERTELVFYTRPDQAGPKHSEYEVVAVPNPAQLKGLLTDALGIRVVVDKRRTVYLYENVRIHLDTVEGLGTFLEFEAVMPDGVPDAEGEAKVRRLMAEFVIDSRDLIEGSYSDMIEQARA